MGCRVRRGGKERDGQVLASSRCGLGLSPGPRLGLGPHPHSGKDSAISVSSHWKRPIQQVASLCAAILLFLLSLSSDYMDFGQIYF